jgi:class 3 adenylate cyclase
MLVEFGSVGDAVRCGVEVQRGKAERNADVPQDKRIEFRMGINVGDVFTDSGDIFGDGVNIAARLEGLAEPGGICVSGRVQEDARGKIDVMFEDIGEQPLNNIGRPVRVSLWCQPAIFAKRSKPDNQPGSAQPATFPVGENPRKFGTGLVG